MKLVEILAREMDEWPAGSGDMWQSEYDLEVYAEFGSFYPSMAAEDRGARNRVTRAMWEAERARIVTTRMDIITESACGEVFRTPCTVIGEYEGRMVVVEDGENKPRFIDRERLHPHMTAEQLAAKEREDAVDDMVSVWRIALGRHSSECYEMAAALHDAGYRRQ